MFQSLGGWVRPVTHRKTKKKYRKCFYSRDLVFAYGVVLSLGIGNGVSTYNTWLRACSVSQSERLLKQPWLESSPFKAFLFIFFFVIPILYSRLWEEKVYSFSVRFGYLCIKKDFQYTEPYIHKHLELSSVVLIVKNGELISCFIWLPKQACALSAAYIRNLGGHPEIPGTQNRVKIQAIDRPSSAVIFGRPWLPFLLWHFEKEYCCSEP